MKATELRIGNIVFDIDSQTEYIIKPIDIFNVTNSTIPIFKHIELTEEWLIKFGFEKEEKVQFYQGYNKGNFHIFEKDSKLYYCSDWWIELKYVNTLQNLFYYLTNQELKLN